MVKKMNIKDSNERLRRVLEAYGADPAKWPEEERIELMLALRAGQADKELREAAVLDRALALTPRPAAPHNGVARLMEALGADAPQNVVKLDTSRTPPAALSVKGFLPASLAIAACLLLGVFMGGTQFGAQYLPVGAIVAANDADVQGDDFLDFDGDGFDDGELL